MRRTHRVVLALVATSALAGAALAPGASAAPAAVHGFVVVLHDGAGPPAAVAERLSNQYGGQVGYVYRYALRGFYLRTTDRAAVALASNPNVDYVEAESPVSVDAQTTPTGVGRIFAADANPSTNEGAVYNAALGINGVDDQRVDVDAAVLDTGIDLDHPDLAVVGSVNCVNVSTAASCTGTGDDVHGHGTHVAGTIAAIDNGIGVVGVAPGARLWSVKVLGDSGSGSNAGVAAGLDWVVQHNNTTTDDIEVANLSLGGGYSTVMNDAVARATDAGVSVVVAAGNDGRDAGNYSPASAQSAITVSALADYNGTPGGGAAWTCYPDTDDTFANFSNYGQVVDIIAPGMCILSAAPGGGTATKSGTSMASPHVAGAVALLRSDPSTNRAAAETALLLAGNSGWNDVDDPDSVKEPLLDVHTFVPTMLPTGGGSTNTPPNAAFSSSCSGLTCAFTDQSTDPGGNVAAWLWDFGDGTSALQNPTHTYAAPGTYPVTLTVTDNGGATGTTSGSVIVSAPPSSPTFTSSSTRTGKSTWKATISVSNASAGQIITGSWDNGGSGSCTAGSTGTCSFSRTKISLQVGSVMWTYTGSPSTSVTVLRP